MNKKSTNMNKKSINMNKKSTNIIQMLAKRKQMWYKLDTGNYS